MRRLALIAALAWPLLAAPPAGAAVTGVAVADREMTRPEGSRHYIVVQPDAPAASPRPLLILLHGHGASAASSLGLAAFGGYRNEDWMRLAAREQLLVIAPDGTRGSDGKRAWNDCRADATTNAVSDDVAFVSALIDTAIAEHHADPARVYVAGISNGGGMAYRLAGELGHRLAAVAALIAVMPAKSGCRPPTHPLSLLALHGTADKITPYDGGEIGHWMLYGRGSGISVEASLAQWRRLDGLDGPPVENRFPHLHDDDPTTATRLVWGRDPAGLQVALIRIDGGGHATPSKEHALPWLLRKLVGEMNRDLDTAEESWRFFRDKRVSGAARGR